VFGHVVVAPLSKQKMGYIRLCDLTDGDAVRHHVVDSVCQLVTDTASTSTWCTEVTSDRSYFTLRADQGRLCRVSRKDISDAFESLLSDIESGDI